MICQSLPALLVGPDPRLAADRTLGFLIARSPRGGPCSSSGRGQAGAVHDARPVASRLLAEAAVLWRTQHQRRWWPAERPGGVLARCATRARWSGRSYLEEVSEFDEDSVSASCSRSPRRSGRAIAWRHSPPTCPRCRRTRSCASECWRRSTATVEHLQGVPRAGRGARYPPAGALRHSSQAGPPDPELMETHQAVIAIAVILAAVGTLAGLVACGRARHCWSLRRLPVRYGDLGALHVGLQAGSTPPSSGW